MKKELIRRITIYIPIEDIKKQTEIMEKYHNDGFMLVYRNPVLTSNGIGKNGKFVFEKVINEQV